jgi:hypothetical protein
MVRQSIMAERHNGGKLLISRPGRRNQEWAGTRDSLPGHAPRDPLPPNKPHLLVFTTSQQSYQMMIPSIGLIH